MIIAVFRVAFPAKLRGCDVGSLTAAGLRIDEKFDDPERIVYRTVTAANLSKPYPAFEDGEDPGFAVNLGYTDGVDRSSEVLPFRSSVNVAVVVRVLRPLPKLTIVPVYVSRCPPWANTDAQANAISSVAMIIL